MCDMVAMDKLIDDLGGIAAVAEMLDVSRSSVSNWRLAGRSIPWRFRAVLARNAADIGITLPADFWEIKRKAKP